MERVQLHNESGFTQHIKARSHQIISDEPVSNGGGDTGPAPYELWLAGLMSCTSLTLRMYAQRKGWELGSIAIDASFSHHADGSAAVERTITLGGDLSAGQLNRLAEIAEKTPVTRTVKQATPIFTTVQHGNPSDKPQTKPST